MLDLQPLDEEYVPTYCGPSTLRIIGLYHGIDRSIEEWAELCNCVPIEGFGAESAGCTGEQFLAGAKKGGLDGFIQDHSTVKDLRYYLKQKIPPVVDWFAEDFYFRKNSRYIDTEGADGHYSAIVQATDRYVLLRDPRCKELIRFRQSDFQRVWFDFNGNCIEKELNNMILQRMIILYPAGEITQHRAQ